MSVILTTTELVDALDGDLLSAIMLHQIRYWCSADEHGVSRLRVRRGDQLWLVKSHQDWWNEIRLTRQQSRKCLDNLRARKLVHTEVHRFNGVPTLHIRLVAENQSIGCPEPNALVASNHSITETTQKTTAETTMATAKEVMMGFSGLKTQPKAVSPSYLGMVWKQRVGLVTGQFVKSLTMADVGKLKHVLKGCEDQALPAMVYAIENWQSFKADVWAKKGETSNPALPEIGFFVKHYDVAVQLIAQPQAVPVGPAVQTGGIAPTTVPGDNPEPQASAETVLDDLAALLQKVQDKTAKD